MKKFIALLLVAVMCFSLGIGGTVAYLTDRETETNVFTVGDVEIELHTDFKQGSKLLPGLKYETNVVIENVGTNDAWVFYDYAVPTAYAPIVKATFAGEGWANAKVLETETTVNNVPYTVYGILHNKPLLPGEKTAANKISFGIDSNVDIEDGKYVVVEGGQITSEIAPVTDVAPVAYLNARAIQVEEFETADDAIKAYFNQWGFKVDNAVVPTLVSTAEELKDVLTKAGSAGAGDSYIVLASDLDMSNVDWTPIEVDGYNGAGVVTIDGGYNTIKGLDAPLFEGGFAGKSGIVIKNLTIANSNIVSTNTNGSGAFIESVDSMETIVLENCHLENSTVKGSRTGGLIGWTSGYSKQNDGPVKTYVTIKDCSVIGCTIEGSSVGGINGHAGASDWTYTTIENCKVLNTILNSTDSGEWRVGQILGTANVGEVTISNCTVGGNTLSQTGKTNPANENRVLEYEEGETTIKVADKDVLVGRLVPGSTGKLVIDGVSKVATASNNDELNDAITSGETTIILGDGEYIIPASAQGKTLTIVGNGEDTKVAVTKVGTGGENCDYGLDGSNVTFENVTITTNSSTYIGYARCNGTYNNCTINGTYTLYGDSVFNNCTFNVTGDVYNIWTWGAPNATFNNCTFNSDGKALLLYGTANTKLTVNGCTFNDNGGLTDLKAAIEIGNDYGKSYELIVNNTTVNGYEINDKGINTGTTLWGNKNSMGPDKLNVVVDGVDLY